MIDEAAAANRLFGGTTKPTEAPAPQPTQKPASTPGEPCSPGHRHTAIQRKLDGLKVHAALVAKLRLLHGIGGSLDQERVSSCQPAGTRGWIGERARAGIGGDVDGVVRRATPHDCFNRAIGLTCHVSVQR